MIREKEEKPLFFTRIDSRCHQQKEPISFEEFEKMKKEHHNRDSLVLKYGIDFDRVNAILRKAGIMNECNHMTETSHRNNNVKNIRSKDGETVTILYDIPWIENIFEKQLFKDMFKEPPTEATVIPVPKPTETVVLTDLTFDNKPVRVIMINGNPWWVAKDVAEVLGYSWAGIRNVQHIPEKWRGVESVSTPSGMQDMHVLSEQGLNFLLFRSDKPLALPFQEWIAGEVLPSIRKTGQYSVVPQLTEDEQVKLGYEILQKRCAILQDRVDKAVDYYHDVKGKIAFAEGLENANIRAVDGDVVVDILNNLGVKIGRTKFYKDLCERKWLTQTPRAATQMAKDAGFLVNKVWLGKSKVVGEEIESRTPKFTIKGIINVCNFYDVKCSVEQILTMLEAFEKKKDKPILESPTLKTQKTLPFPDQFVENGKIVRAEG